MFKKGLIIQLLLLLVVAFYSCENSAIYNSNVSSGSLSYAKDSNEEDLSSIEADFISANNQHHFFVGKYYCDGYFDMDGTSYIGTDNPKKLMKTKLGEQFKKGDWIYGLTRTYDYSRELPFRIDRINLKTGTREIVYENDSHVGVIYGDEFMYINIYLENTFINPIKTIRMDYLGRNKTQIAENYSVVAATKEKLYLYSEDIEKGGGIFISDLDGENMIEIASNIKANFIDVRRNFLIFDNELYFNTTEDLSNTEYLDIINKVSSKNEVIELYKNKSTFLRYVCYNDHLIILGREMKTFDLKTKGSKTWIFENSLDMTNITIDNGKLFIFYKNTEDKECLVQCDIDGSNSKVIISLLQ